MHRCFLPVRLEPARTGRRRTAPISEFAEDSPLPHAADHDRGPVRS